jgi:hypothetical protein
LHEIALWPAAELELFRAYLLKKPPAEERIEMAIARGQALYINRHLKEGVPERTPADYLPFLDPWPEPVEVGNGRYSALDLEIMRGLN